MNLITEIGVAHIVGLKCFYRNHVSLNSYLAYLAFPQDVHDDVRNQDMLNFVALQYLKAPQSYLISHFFGRQVLWWQFAFFCCCHKLDKQNGRKLLLHLVLRTSELHSTKLFERLKGPGRFAGLAITTTFECPTTPPSIPPHSL